MTQRTYTVGLPVSITVHDDGTVEFITHVEDAQSAISDTLEELENHGEANVDADVIRLEAWFDQFITDVVGSPVRRA